jgi:ribosomal protein S18 acetylase RimI-like enzyme
MTTPIQIRLAGREDAELVAGIGRRTFIDSFGVYNTTENMDLFLNKQFTREMQMAEVGAPGRIFLLANCGEEPAGYASMRESDPPPGLDGSLSGQGSDSQDRAPSPGFQRIAAIEIRQIYSEQKMIGKGVGKALMNRCIEIAREMNKTWIWLGVWEHNARAIAFYQKCGFERFGDHPFVLGTEHQTDWLMKKRL